MLKQICEKVKVGEMILEEQPSLNLYLVIIYDET